MTTENKEIIVKTDQEVSTLDAIQKEVERELATPANYGTVMLTAFSAFRGKENAATLIKQSCVKAMALGYSMKDIIKGKVYFIPFGSSAQLVQSIEDVRSIAMKSGQAGKDKPIYVTDENNSEKIISCEVTVYRIIQGQRVPYTAEVYFKEYDKGRDNWKAKPRTMIAKVAEMHALRMAFPEVLEQVYVEEEFDKSIEDEKEKVEEQSRVDDALEATDYLKLKNLGAKKDENETEQEAE